MIQIDTKTCYYSLELLSKKFKIDISRLKYVLDNVNEAFIVTNAFKYRYTYYINIRVLLYLLYKYRKTDNEAIDDVYKYIILRLHNLNKLNSDILGHVLFRNQLPGLTASILIFNQEEIAGYVYLIGSKDYVKIGVSSNPLVRLSTIKDENGNKCVILYLLYFDTMVYARVKERELHRKYAEFRHHGEWFTNTNKIIERVKTDYSAHIIL